MEKFRFYLFLHQMVQSLNSMSKNSNQLKPFHLAIPVNDLESAKKFYHGLLGCDIGRSSSEWIDFNFFGHQLVCHLSNGLSSEITNLVDSNNIPVPHFGLVLSWDDFKSITSDLNEKKIEFLIEPTLRFKGEVGEQATAFLRDPSGNAIELKSFKDMDNLFRAE